METIKWGSVGVGDVTEIKSGPPLYKCENSELVAVMRRTADKAKDFAERHNVPRWYDNGDDLINDEEVDVVYIATPTYAHKDYVIQAALAGKHVYCEKPMGVTYADCQEMIAACDLAGVKLWVAYYRRAMPRMLKIKSLIDDGAIGHVVAVSIEHFQPSPYTEDTPESDLSWHHAADMLGGGQPMDVGCHQIDLINYWFGNIIDVKGYVTNQRGLYRSADTMSATFTFNSGVVGSAIWNFTTGHRHEMMTVVGTAGEIRFSVFAPTPITLSTQSGTETIEYGYPEHVHQPLIETIIAELNGDGECPSTGVTGSHTSWVIDQLFENFRQQL